MKGLDTLQASRFKHSFPHWRSLSKFLDSECHTSEKKFTFPEAYPAEAPCKHPQNNSTDELVSAEIMYFERTVSYLLKT